MVEKIPAPTIAAIPIATRSRSFKTFFKPDPEWVASDRPDFASARMDSILFLRKRGLDMYKKLYGKLMEINFLMRKDKYVKEKNGINEKKNNNSTDISTGNINPT